MTTSKLWNPPVEYCEDDAAVEGCIDVLVATEKRFGTSAFIDAIDEMTHDPEHQARRRGARPLTTAHVRQVMLNAAGDDEALTRHVEQEEVRVGAPFPGSKGVRRPHTLGDGRDTIPLILSLGGMSIGSVLLGVGLALHSLGLA